MYRLREVRRVKKVFQSRGLCSEDVVLAVDVLEERRAERRGVCAGAVRVGRADCWRIEGFWVCAFVLALRLCVVLKGWYFVHRGAVGMEGVATGAHAAVDRRVPSTAVRIGAFMAVRCIVSFGCGEAVQLLLGRGEVRVVAGDGLMSKRRWGLRQLRDIISLDDVMLRLKECIGFIET